MWYYLEKNLWARSCKSRERNHVSHLNEDMDHRIIKLLENSSVLIEGTLSAIMLGIMLTRKGFIRAGKGVKRAARGYDSIDQKDKNY